MFSNFYEFFCLYGGGGNFGILLIGVKSYGFFQFVSNNKYYDFWCPGIKSDFLEVFAHF